MPDADLAVVGAGPAGLATAIAARLRGLRVILLDARHPPIDKACGEALLPEALEAARRMGLDLPLHQGSPVAGIRFVQDGNVVESRFRGLLGRSFRRTALSHSLVQQAEQLGVDLRWGVSVTGLHANKLQTNTGTVESRFIAAADGERSPLRRQLGLDRPASTTRYAFRQHFACEPWTPLVEVHWGLRCQVYVTPLEGQVGVAVISSDPHDRVATVLQRFPALSQQLTGFAAASAERGAATTSRSLPRVIAGPVALVGDAAGTVDAITGEGMGLGFLQAELLVQSLEHGGLHRYQAGHAALLRKARWMGRALLLADHHPSAARLAMRLLQRHPGWFEELLAFHTAPGKNPLAGSRL